MSNGLDFAHHTWPKTPRLYHEVEITEKVDGTNAQILIAHRTDIPEGLHITFDIYVPGYDLYMRVGSRKRWLTPTDDNHGFWEWVRNRAYQFAALPTGRYYGEFWGHGIQRGYGMPQGERGLALFNTELVDQALPDGVDTVPVLYHGPFHDSVIDDVMMPMIVDGSYLVPGYHNPEGIVLYHKQARQRFKVTLDGDAKSETHDGVPSYTASSV